jgi:hypothetical protein
MNIEKGESHGLLPAIRAVRVIIGRIAHKINAHLGDSFPRPFRKVTKIMHLK